MSQRILVGWEAREHGHRQPLVEECIHPPGLDRHRPLLVEGSAVGTFIVVLHASGGPDQHESLDVMCGRERSVQRKSGTHRIADPRAAATEAGECFAGRRDRSPFGARQSVSWQIDEREGVVTNESIRNRISRTVPMMMGLREPVEEDQPRDSHWLACSALGVVGGTCCSTTQDADERVGLLGPWDSPLPIDHEGGNGGDVEVACCRDLCGNFASTGT